ncbi:hypothetical protein QFC20_001066 [Naganishia adeliensis]|uniref:Uncharacterized protein n=1 Tax=Naganishia adeliensis TaxID=92952 RepID=A0ACC2WVM8_9TREE|nr:hypothetical protein QFC20_001066 [Naganishia adeliensis]
MKAIRRAGPRAKYYLARQSAADDQADYGKLEIRDHREIMEQALEVDQGTSKTARDRLGREVGINGQNLMKQLLGLWKGTYKATMMTGDPTIDEDYVLSEHQWDLSDREVAQSTKLVPAQMAPSLTSVTERGYWNADSYALYYRFDAKFLPVCTAPLHALLHMGECIRRQGPPCHYWCYTMERYGGWVKREVLKNRKRPIEALNNRVFMQEQISQVLSTIEHADELVAWMNAVSSLSADRSTETADEKETYSHVGYRGRLVDAEKGGYVPSIKVLRALAEHMETEEWTAARQTSKSLVRYLVDDIKGDVLGAQNGAAANLTIVATLAGRKFTTPEQDIQWGKPRGRRLSGGARFKKILSFDWEGTTRCAAVIMPCREDTVDWTPGRPKGTGPQFVKTDNRPQPLQVVDLKALITIAGRVPRPGLKGMVVFDTSRGLLDPELLNV